MSASVVKLKNPAQVNGHDILVEVVTITPNEAAKWLQCNHNNRPIRKRHVEFLAREIISGNWQVNGQAIVISDDEAVLDGQHRLSAIIEAGKPVQSLVVYGIKPEAFKTMDTGAVRTGSDALALYFHDKDRGIVKTVGSAIHWCDRLEKSFYGQVKRISNTDIIAYVVQHPSIWACAEYIHSMPKDARPITAACGTALYEIFQRKDTELAAEFMRRFFTGELLAQTDVEYVLRAALIRDAQRLTGYPIDIRMKMCVKAWNWRRRGRLEANRSTIAMNPMDPERLGVL